MKFSFKGNKKREIGHFDGYCNQEEEEIDVQFDVLLHESTELMEEDVSGVLKKAKLQIGEIESLSESFFSSDSDEASINAVFGGMQCAMPEYCGGIINKTPDSGLPVSQSSNCGNSSNIVGKADKIEKRASECKKVVINEEIKKIRHREAQQKYKKKVAKSLKELRAHKQNSDREHALVLEKCRARDIVVQELRAIITVQAEEISQLEKVLSSKAQNH